MLILDTSTENINTMSRDIFDVNPELLTFDQKASLQSAFEVYMRSVIMLERIDSATSSRAYSVASMAIAAGLLLFLAVPPAIIVAMVLSAEILGVVIGKATRRAVVKAINESQTRLREEIKTLKSNAAKPSLSIPPSSGARDAQQIEIRMKECA